MARGVAIGAQVSYRDLAGFGRREMAVPAEELTAEVLYQIAALDGIARAEGGRVSYVKPHGALYNRAVRDPARRRRSPPRSAPTTRPAAADPARRGGRRARPRRRA